MPIATGFSAVPGGIGVAEGVSDGAGVEVGGSAVGDTNKLGRFPFDDALLQAERISEKAAMINTLKDRSTVFRCLLDATRLIILRFYHQFKIRLIAAGELCESQFAAIIMLHMEINPRCRSVQIFRNSLEQPSSGCDAMINYTMPEYKCQRRTI